MAGKEEKKANAISIPVGSNPLPPPYIHPRLAQSSTTNGFVWEMGSATISANSPATENSIGSREAIFDGGKSGVFDATTIEMRWLRSEDKGRGKGRGVCLSALPSTRLSAAALTVGTGNAE